MNVTLVSKNTYKTGRESGERQTSAREEKFVRAHWFLYIGRTDLKNYDRLWATITRVRTDV